MVVGAPQCRKGHPLVRIHQPKLLRGWVRGHTCHDCSGSIPREATRFHCKSCEVEVCFRCMLGRWKPTENIVSDATMSSLGTQLDSEEIPHLWNQNSPRMHARNSLERLKVKLCPMADWIFYDPDSSEQDVDFQKKAIRRDGYICRMRPLQTPRQGVEDSSNYKPIGYVSQTLQHQFGRLEYKGRDNADDSESSEDAEEELNCQSKDRSVESRAVSHIEAHCRPKPARIDCGSSKDVDGTLPHTSNPIDAMASECVVSEDSPHALPIRRMRLHVRDPVQPGLAQVRSERDPISREGIPHAFPNLLPPRRPVHTELAEVKPEREERSSVWPEPHGVVKQVSVLPTESLFPFKGSFEHKRMEVELDALIPGCLQSNETRDIHIDSDSGECAPESFLVCYPSLRANLFACHTGHYHATI